MKDKTELKSLLLSRKGEAGIDVAVVMIAVMLCIALAVTVSPAFVVKQQLDTFAAELCREAEIAGGVGAETSARERTLREQIGISPTVEWAQSGNVQLNEDISVTVTMPVDIGFSNFGSFPITLTAKASGKSEVYYK